MLCRLGVIFSPVGVGGTPLDQFVVYVDQSAKRLSFRGVEDRGELVRVRASEDRHMRILKPNARFNHASCSRRIGSSSSRLSRSVSSRVRNVCTNLLSFGEDEPPHEVVTP